MSGLAFRHAGVIASNAAVAGQSAVASTRSAGVRRCALRATRPGRVLPSGLLGWLRG